MTNKQSFLSWFFLLAIAVFSPLVAAAPQFEFGKINYSNCLEQACTINFDTDFNTTPYVFVMPTIGVGSDGRGDWKSAPSSIRIMSRGLKSATFKQFVAPSRAIAGSNNYYYKNIKPKPMTEFHYLAIEKGVVDLGDGGTIVAGEVNTNGFLWQGLKWNDIKGDNSKYNVTPHRYSEFGFQGQFSGTPGILTQVQTTNNKYQSSTSYYNRGEPIWLTSMGWHLEGWSRTSRSYVQKIKVAMETSEVHTRTKQGKHQPAINKPPWEFRPQASEKIAFVAAEGSGFISGKKFWLGSIQTKNTHKDPDNGNQDLDKSDPEDRVAKPVTIACQHNVLEFEEDFPAPPVILVGKNSRSGPNGGWIRRCKLNKDRVTVQVEEDLDRDSERQHASELTGVFIFEGRKQGAYCDVFPGPAQTWIGNANESLIISNNALITGTRAIQGKRVVGFNNISGQGIGEGCDGNLCNPMPGLMVKKEDLIEYSLENKPDINVEQNTVFTEQNHGELRLVSVNKHKILTIKSGVYWNESMNINGTVVIPEGEKVIIHTKALALSNNATFKVVDNSKVDNLLIYVHPGEPYESPYHRKQLPSQVLLSNNSEFRGLIYSEKKVDLSNNAVLTGALTAMNVHLHNNSEVIGESSCFTPSIDYEIKVEPDTDFSLTCDLQEVEFSVWDSGSVATDFAGQLRITTNLSRSGLGKWFTNSNGSGQGVDASSPYIVTPVAGKVKLWLKSDFVGKVDVTGVIVDDDADPAFSSLNFVPFKFDINSGHIPVVAGKPASVTIKAKSCRDGSKSDIAIGYHGKRKLEFATSYISPSQGLPNASSEKLQLRAIGQSDWQDEKLELTFDKGVANAQLRYLDAGKTSLTIHDPNCTLDKGCEILPQSRMLTRASIGDWTRLEGSQSVWSRPYTFALCNAGEHLIESAAGTATSGNAFIPAGEEFNVKAKPVIWLAGDADNIDANGNATALVDSSNMCGRSVTPGFYASDAPKATVALSIPTGEGVRPHSPNKAGAVSGNLTSIPLSNEAIKNSNFAAKWNEVGSIQLQAATQSNYLGMTMNMGYRPVGRFYPDAFTLVSAESGKRYPDGQSFAYMDQPFAARFKVEAQNKDGEPTRNYGYFAKAMQVGLDIAAIDTGMGHGYVNDLSGRVDWGGLLDNWEKSWQQAYITVNWFNLAFKRDVLSAASEDKAITTKSDGPYDVALGIMQEEMSVSERNRIGYPKINVDMTLFPCDLGQDGCTDADSRGAMQFATFNTRYGRMALDDVSGRFDSELAIPLRVEYWDGFDFVTNKQDSRAVFDGKLACTQIISQSDTTVTSTSYTQGSGNVKSGVIRSGEFVAVPTEVKDDDGNRLIYREQVRFWQKVISDKPKAIDNEPEIRCVVGPSSDHGNYQPWLTFDWRSKGDESPHSTVTFGAYRGNDRVLYRGEKGINTMLD